MKPEVSILMPVKNAGKYLEECLTSIVEQTFTDWELIAVDDHSTDHSRELLKQWSQKDKRILWVQNEGKGIIPALRSAYQVSKGAMIHRMDADDVMTQNKLELLVHKLKAVGRGNVITAKVSYFAADGVSDGYRKYEAWLNQLTEKEKHWEEIYQECVIASPCWLVYRDDFNHCGGFMEDRYPEDYDLVFRFYAGRLKVQSVQEILHLWRDHSERTSRNHPHYQANSFFSLKLHYFFQLDRDSSRPLLVWGAGPKGKILAKLLKKMGVDFKWVSNNPNKHGQDIYGKLMRSFQEIIQIDNPQVIITVAQRKAKKEIITFLHSNDLKEKRDFYFFR